MIKDNADYSAHPWAVDVAVYIYDDTPITDEEIDDYFTAISECLGGECFIGYDVGDRGFSFWADKADEEFLNELLAELEARGCIVEYPDWYDVNDVDKCAFLGIADFNPY